RLRAPGMWHSSKSAELRTSSTTRLPVPRVRSCTRSEGSVSTDSRARKWRRAPSGGAAGCSRTAENVGAGCALAAGDIRTSGKETLDERPTYELPSTPVSANWLHFSTELALLEVPARRELHSSQP